MVGETNWDALVSNTYRLGGTDGNAKTGKYQIGTATSYSNSFNTAGLTVQQGGADDESLSLKSTDITHGMTSLLETDTYGAAKKRVATTGGLLLAGATSNIVGLEPRGYATNADTTRTATSGANVYVNAWLKSGTGANPHGTSDNIFGVANGDGTRLLLTGNGDLYLDATSNASAWDDHDDLALLEAFRVATGVPPDYRQSFVQDLAAHGRVLQDTGVLVFNEDGHHFVSIKGLFGLLIDAVRQTNLRLGERLLALEGTR